jgi:hypothetical protein
MNDQANLDIPLQHPKLSYGLLREDTGLSRLIKLLKPNQTAQPV